MSARALHRIRAASHGHGVGKVNVTPMIDVVMCLIIFFLLVGRLAVDKRVILPESSTGELPDAVRPVIVEIVPAPSGEASGPMVAVGGTPIGVERLADQLKIEARINDPEAPQRPVQIRAPADLPYSLLSPVLTACRRAGLTSVRLMAERVP